MSDVALPHPNPLPQERKSRGHALQTFVGPSLEFSAGTTPPSPWGEGWGEGGCQHSAITLRSSGFLTVLSFLAIGILSLAAAPDTSAPSKGAATRITSKTVDFDLKARQAVYHGNVVVQDPRIQLTCEILTATIAESGGRVDSLVAESNVVAVIATNNTVFTITSSKAVYSYQLTPQTTNQTLELSGLPEPKITWPQTNDVTAKIKTNEFTARRILWNISAGNIKAEGQRGDFPDVDALKKVAAPSAATNEVVAPKSATP